MLTAGRRAHMVFLVLIGVPSPDLTPVWARNHTGRYSFQIASVAKLLAVRPQYFLRGISILLMARPRNPGDADISSPAT